MEIEGIIWLREIVEKNEYKHHVSQQEVEDVFGNNPKIRFLKKGKVEGENLYFALGRSNAGRYLTVFFIYKNNKEALPISARDMSTKERKQYDKK